VKRHVLLFATAVALFPAWPTHGQAPAPAQAPSILSATIPTPVSPPGPWTRSRREVARAESPPVIDGVLDDATWRTATHALGFQRAIGGAPIPNQTEAWIAADEHHLYVAFHCQDSEPHLIRAEQTQRGGVVWNDDYVGVDIDSQNTRQAFSSFVVSAGGVQWEHREGGTADNVTWAGDWRAAVSRVPDGWTAEMAIPFRGLRYPKGARAMGLLLYRRIGRENTTQVWPFLPREGTDEDVQARYMDEFVGLNPPDLTARPVYLPYVLATAGDGAAVKAGLDVKYPLTPTLTAVGTLNPDFDTVEQAVTDISFSYTEKFLDDRRPFFAEGADFLPPLALFYSRRVEDIDAGVKLVGKDGATSIGALGAFRAGDDRLNLGMLQVERQLGLLNRIGFSGVSSDGRDGPDANSVARLYGTYGFHAGEFLLSLSAHRTQSWQGGRAAGSETFARIATDFIPGRPVAILDLRDIEPDFESGVGYVPERNIRGYFLRLRQFNKFEGGPLAFYEAWITTEDYDRHTGGFYRSNLFYGAVAQNHAGWQLFAETGNARRDGFLPEDTSGTRYDDRITTLQLSWGNRTLLKSGSVMGQFGKQANESYSLLTMRQGFVLSRPLTASASWSRVKVGDYRATQAILNAAYRIDNQAAFGGRVVVQGGDTSLFLSYGRQVRAGTDVFVLYGEPDPMKSTRTTNKITVKLVRPL